RQAVRFFGAVAATFADGVVDKHAAGRVGVGTALAAAAFFGGAGLVVDQNGGAFNVAQLALYAIELVAMVNGRVAGKRHTLELLGLVGDDHNFAHPFGVHLRNQVGNPQGAVDGLAAGHGDGVVVQDLVGDVHARRHGRPYGQDA